MTTDRNSEAACHRWLRNGEPVQHEYWSNGVPTEAQFKAATTCREMAQAEWTVEYAYTTPPATIPVAGLEALGRNVRALRSVAEHSPIGSQARCEIRRIADELAQLIQEAK